MRAGAGDPQPLFVGANIAGDDAHTALLSEAFLSDGGFAMVWHTATGDIIGQTFQANGLPEGAAFPIAATANAELDPSVAGLPFDTYVVTWAETTGAGYTVFGQFFDPLGAFDTPLNLGTSDNSVALQTPQGEVAPFCFDGSYVLVWVKNEAGDSDIRATVVDPFGVPLGSLELSDTALVDESNPAVAMIADELFAATWVEPGASARWWCSCSTRRERRVRPCTCRSATSPARRALTPCGRTSRS